MPTLKQHTPGTFCWWELTTPGMEAAWRFYHTLFRWEKRDNPIGPGQVYRICVLEGEDVGAMYQAGNEPGGQQAPTGWLPYIAVESADAIAATVASAGGSVLLQPFDVFTSGRMAVSSDSEGARFAMWEPNQHRGAGIFGEVGTVVWTELMAHDVARARSFYSRVFGWKTESKAMGPGGEYLYLSIPGQSQAFGGMLPIDPSWGAMPASWMTYFRVADCDDVAALAGSHGGEVHKAPFDIPGVGRMAILADPTGAGFAIIKVEPVSSKRWITR